MLRTLAMLGFVLGLASCDNPRGAREVPVSKPTDEAQAADPATATRAPRAIPMH